VQRRGNAAPAVRHDDRWKTVAVLRSRPEQLAVEPNAFTDDGNDAKADAGGGLVIARRWKTRDGVRWLTQRGGGADQHYHACDSDR